MPLLIAPVSAGVLEQREITVHTYQTTVAFNCQALSAALANAWLSPTISLGVFSPPQIEGTDAIHVVLGLHGEQTVRKYDYDERTPLWYSIQGLIVETVAIRYHRNESGHIRFTTAGGRVRITDSKLADFNATFLGIPRDAVHGLEFDPAKLRDLCFGRFPERLYEIRFSNTSATGYESIDHTSFQSRGYIDAKSGRLSEILPDSAVLVESFESDLEMITDDLASKASVGFAVRGKRGALRLTFPKVSYKAPTQTPEEQTRVFYHLVDRTVDSILDRDCYARLRLAVAGHAWSPDLPMFPTYVDPTPFREPFMDADTRRVFICDLDITADRHTWLPQLQAIDSLFDDASVRAHVEELVGNLVRQRPDQAIRLLTASREASGLDRVGALAADALLARLQSITADNRSHAEEALLAWLVEKESDSWDVDLDSEAISARSLRWQAEDLSMDALAVVIWKVVTVLHKRLLAATGDVTVDLRKFAWCVQAAAALPPNHPRTHAALRLVAGKRVPRTVGDAARVLKQPVANLRALDDELLVQFELPTWPSFRAAAATKGITLSNVGLGAAHRVSLLATGTTATASPQFDLPPASSADVPSAAHAPSVDVTFEKYGARHQVTVVVGEAATLSAERVIRVPAAISRKRVAAQRELRLKIDPTGQVIGSSPAVLQLFEEIEYANTVEGEPAVLILGETGVGKTHIARLLHEAGKRAAGEFKSVTAAGGGGDPNIQRGEWIGHGRNSGVTGIGKDGTRGHLLQVDGGTLFVDEFALLSPDIQGVFLAVLERQEIQMVGGDTVKPNVRCVFATNADVDALAAGGALKPDLLARIPVTFKIPPLRDRPGDVLLLARVFAGADKRFTERALLAFVRYGWPANVRELQNKVRGAVARAKVHGANEIDVTTLDLPAELLAAVGALSDDEARRELWTLADDVARQEGFEPNKGLQRRAGEIVGVGESQASRVYGTPGLIPPRA